MRKSLRGTVFSVLSAAALTLAPLSGPAQAATPVGPAATASSPMGVFAGSAAEGVQPHKEFEKWLGAPVPYAVDFASASVGWRGIDNPTWIFNAWNQTSYRLVLSLQMFPKDVEANVGGPAALQQCANGAYSWHWRALAGNLVASGLPTTIVRPGWEMNNSWFGWAANGRTSTYVACYRNIVDSMRSVPGQSFSFVWNPSVGTGDFPAEQAYPGDDYVDSVGLDLYDWSWGPGLYDTKATQTSDQRLAAEQTVWAKYLTGDHGLRFWSSFAANHAKPMSFPEWGLADRWADDFGGGDNPYFVTQMMKYIYDPANNVQFAAYFDVQSPDAEHRVDTSGLFPQAGRAFQAAAKTPPVPAAATACAAFVLPTPFPVTSYPLLASDDGSRTGQPLDGRTVAGNQLHAWLGADPAIKHVQFFVDDVAGKAAPVIDEYYAPFDMGATVPGSGLSGTVDTSGWTPGVHTVTAKVFLKDGSVTFVNASVLQPAPKPVYVFPANASSPYPMLASADGSYQGTPLDGQTLTGWALYSWIPASSDIKHVQFFLDNAGATGTPVRDEWSAPYDLGGSTTTGSAATDTTEWTTGIHTITAKVFLKTGATTLVSASVLKPAKTCGS